MAPNNMTHSNKSVPAASVSSAGTSSTARRQRGAWLAALGLCGLCSCTSLATPRANDPFHSPPRQSSQQAMETSAAQPAAGRARLPSTPLAATQQFQQIPVAVRRPMPSQIQLASNQAALSARTDHAVERVAAEARTPAVTPDAYAAGPALGDDGASPSAYPDEYLFDGGDRDYPITRDLDQFRGLDTEDTIAEWEDETGKARIKKTNRVAIYAPRFGSVVTVNGPNSETLVDKVHGHVASQGGVNLRNRTVTSSQEQKLGTGRMDTRLRATGVGTEIAIGSLNRGQGRAVSIAVMNTHEAFRRLHGNQFEGKLSPNLMEGMQFAEIWTRKENPVIEGHFVSATQSVTVQAQADFTGIEDNGKRGELFLRKTADKGVAAIDDIVTFTLHFENRGDRELKNVVLIDNLTPRLEYLADKTSTDLPGKVETEDNGEGSVILRFILDEPLAGRTKGSITFQARVR